VESFFVFRNDHFKGGEKMQNVSYLTCGKCQVKVERNAEGRYICPVCNQEIKPISRGWAGGEK